MNRLKLTMIIGLTIMSFGTFAQSMLNFDESDIRKKYSDKEFSVVLATDTSMRYIVWEDNLTKNYYYFDKQTNMCTECFTGFKTSGALNGWVQRFNNDYVIISDKEWKLYLDNGIIDCKLMKLGDLWYFDYKEAK